VCITLILQVEIYHVQRSGATAALTRKTMLPVSE